MIPDRTVDEVRERADLVEVVGESVQLKKAGREWKGRCPFHDDRTPSFYVVPEKGFYTCFGCGESGDVFAYLMKRTGMDFTDAVKHLGARFGVDVRESGSRPEDDPNRPLYEANAFARDWFISCLNDAEIGTQARRYLEERGIDADTSRRFGLGFAPDGWRGLRDHATSHRLSEELLLSAGLLTTSDKVTEPYDRFRNRIIFPIESVGGKVVAFGGRVLGAGSSGSPKYLNSPESPIYRKGENLYALGWNRNAIRREETVLVVEGYMDVVSIASAGVENAVATLGTAMTEEQARLLRRYTRRVLLLFDSDEAGLRATFRAGDVLLAEGIHPSVVTFPPGDDPDTVVRAHGADGLRRHLAASVDLLDRKIQLLDEKGYFESIDRTRRALDKLLPTIRAVSDPALRDLYVAKVAERTRIRRETIEEEAVRRDPRRAAGTRGPTLAAHPGRREPAAGKRPVRAPILPGLGAERLLLMVLLHARERIDRAAEHIGPMDFTDPVYREIFERLLDDHELSADSEGLEPALVRRLEELAGDREELEHTGQVFEASVSALREQGLQRRQSDLEGALRAAPPERQRAMLAELDRLRKERQGRWNVIRREAPVGSNHQKERKDR